MTSSAMTTPSNRPPPRLPAARRVCAALFALAALAGCGGIGGPGQLESLSDPWCWWWVTNNNAWEVVNGKSVNTCLGMNRGVRDRGDGGQTALHHAAGYNERAGTVQALIHAGANANARDAAGQTPLHWLAAHNGSVPVLNALLAAGANAEAADNDGNKPLDLARNNPGVRAALDRHIQRMRAAAQPRPPNPRRANPVAEPAPTAAEPPPPAAEPVTTVAPTVGRKRRR